MTKESGSIGGRVFTASLVLAGAAFLSSRGSAQPASATARILVGPNILVSRDGDVAHCETMISANPRDPKNLLGGSITMTRPDGGATNKSYASLDGGATWYDAGFPEEAEGGGGDPQAGFGATGTAYFTGISLKSGIYFCRSEDGGKTWGKGVSFGNGDHEQLVTDDTLGPFAGRVYVADERSQKGSHEIEDLQMHRRVVLFRSTDDGRSFVGPIEVAVGDGRGLAVYNLLVLSDGTLFVPMSQYPNYAVEKDASTWKSVFSISRDGGVTFSPKKPIAEILFGGVKVMRKQQESGRIDQIGGPAFAVDRSAKYRDRIYTAFTELDGDRFRLMVSHSGDRGATWSKPKAVDPPAAPSTSQFQQMIAVNSDGVVGVFYYSTEGFPERERFDAYFTASRDGGETFSPKVRVSSETSRPLGPGNLRPGPFVSRDRGMIVVDMVSGVSRWPDGGDYIGMTADSDGVFHPFWTDARSGTYQLYSCAIRVGAESPAKLPALEKASISDRVTLVFDPLQYDMEKREVLMPVRLKNTSKETLYPPFQIEVKELIHPYEVKSGDSSRAIVPEILNASNGKTGVGATFDYSKSLHDLESLGPDGVSDAIVWRLKAPSPVKTGFHIGTEVSGFVAKKEGKKSDSE